MSMDIVGGRDALIVGYLRMVRTFYKPVVSYSVQVYLDGSAQM